MKNFITKEINDKIKQQNKNELVDFILINVISNFSGGREIKLLKINFHTYDQIKTKHQINILSGFHHPRSSV